MTVERWIAPEDTLCRTEESGNLSVTHILRRAHEVVLSEAYDEAIAERDRARDLAVKLEQQNARIIGFLLHMRDDLTAGGRTLLTIDDLLEAIDLTLADIAEEVA